MKPVMYKITGLIFLFLITPIVFLAIVYEGQHNLLTNYNMYPVVEYVISTIFLMFMITNKVLPMIAFITLPSLVITGAICLWIGFKKPKLKQPSSIAIKTSIVTIIAFILGNGAVYTLHYFPKQGILLEPVAFFAGIPFIALLLISCILMVIVLFKGDESKNSA
ncbi:MAG: hypothetical protein ABII07_01015 [Patescibacteria group bacterium]|nr:hypothetical protein [Patescibacteria group bacterium]